MKYKLVTDFFLEDNITETRQHFGKGDKNVQRTY